MIAEAVHRPRVSWFTNTIDGREHAVADEEYAQAREDHAPPETLCDRIMVPASMAAEIGPRCQVCTAYVHARGTLTDLTFGDEPGWLARRLRHLKTSWPFQGGPRPARHGQEPNHGGLAAPPTAGAAVLHP